MERTAKTLIITLCGLATSLVTAIILVLVEVYGHYTIYGRTIWLIVPVGAIGSGVAASIGYYGGAKYTNYRPDRLLLVSVVGISILTFFALYYLKYAAYQAWDRGRSGPISYVQYLQLSITNLSLSVGDGRNSDTSDGIELGVWGYGAAVLQIAGFSVGGLAVFYMLRMQPYCAECSRYLVKKGELLRKSVHGAEQIEQTQRILKLINDGDLQEAIRMHSSVADQGLGSRITHRSLMLLRRCPVCERHQLDYKVTALTNGSWRQDASNPASTPQMLTM